MEVAEGEPSWAYRIKQTKELALRSRSKDGSAISRVSYKNVHKTIRKLLKKRLIAVVYRKRDTQHRVFYCVTPLGWSYLCRWSAPTITRAMQNPKSTFYSTRIYDAVLKRIVSKKTLRGLKLASTRGLITHALEQCYIKVARAYDPLYPALKPDPVSDQVSEVETSQNELAIGFASHLSRLSEISDEGLIMTGMVDWVHDLELVKRDIILCRAIWSNEMRRKYEYKKFVSLIGPPAPPSAQ